MAMVRGNGHLLLKEIMGDKTWTEVDLSAAINRPIYGTRSILRGMINRREVLVIKPKKLPGQFKYRLKGSK